MELVTADRRRVRTDRSNEPDLFWAVRGGGGSFGIVDLTPEAVNALFAVVGPGSGSPLVSVELRQLGGAVAQDSPAHGAVGAIDAGFALFAVGMGADAEMTVVEARVEALKAALGPWTAARGYFNFADGPGRARASSRPTPTAACSG